MNRTIDVAHATLDRFCLHCLTPVFPITSDGQVTDLGTGRFEVSWFPIPSFFPKFHQRLAEDLGPFEVVELVHPPGVGPGLVLGDRDR